MAVPDFWSQYVSPNLNRLVRKTIFIASINASFLLSPIFTLLRMWCVMLDRAGSVLMFVYMECASAVNGSAFGGNPLCPISVSAQMSP